MYARAGELSAKIQTNHRIQADLSLVAKAMNLATNHHSTTVAERRAVVLHPTQVTKIVLGHDQNEVTISGSRCKLRC